MIVGCVVGVVVLFAAFVLRGVGVTDNFFYVFY